MLFNSLQFVCFFLVVRLFYSFLKPQQQNFLLLLASYGFYAAWDERFLGLILFSTIIDYVSGRCVATSLKPKCWLLISVAANLAILGFFKYYNFFASEFSELMSLIGWQVSMFEMTVLLPVGISFYTFQSMSYTIDIYRGRIKPCRSFYDFALYVAFFPQLVAGPIERAKSLLPQIQKVRIVTRRHWEKAIWFLLLGYFQKVVVADNLWPFVKKIANDPGSVLGGDLIIGFYAIVIYIYADFSGYSNIARGLANCFGIDLIQNFRMPLFARNPVEFWRRWHVSLTNWFRDYVFKPLAIRFGGGKASRWSLAVSMVVTLLLVGLWHGAAWSYVVFGAYHACLLLGYISCKRWWRHRVLFQRLPNIIGRSLVHLLAFHIISFGTIFFVICSPELWKKYFISLGEKDLTLFNPIFVSTFVLLTIPFLGLDLFQERRRSVLAVVNLSPWQRGVIGSFLWVLILVAGATEQLEFVYFQF